MNGSSSNSGSPAFPMKFVATPRPDRNVRKSIVGPLIDALRPPAHSTCATLSPPRSAACAIDSACRMFGANAEVLAVPNAWPFVWNVLFVEPCTPGHAPVASEYHPAPVFGGACVSNPLPDADVPRRSRRFIVEKKPAYFGIRSWRRPSAAKNTAFGVFGAKDVSEIGAAAGAPAGTAADARPTGTVSKLAASANARSETTLRERTDTRREVTGEPPRARPTSGRRPSGCTPERKGLIHRRVLRHGRRHQRYQDQSGKQHRFGREARQKN